MKTYVYKTTDLGKTWKPLATEAIKSYAHVIREDLVNPNLLLVGTEFGLFVSVDGGEQWAPFTGNLPNVSVRDIAIHPRESDVILATHGRGIMIIDDMTPLRQITSSVLASEVHLFESRPSKTVIPVGEQEFSGDGEYAGRNPDEAAIITYYLKERHVFGDLKLEIYDAEGKLMTTLPGGKRRGINRVKWYMRLKPPKVPPAPTLAGRGLFGPMVPEGTYTVKLIKGDKTYNGQIKLVADPKLPHVAEDRAVQQQTVMKLYRMQERLAFIAAAVTDARDQAKARAQKLKAGEKLATNLEAFADKLDRLHKTLVATKEGSFITGEEQLRERVVDLYGAVSSYGGKPTESQLGRLMALDQEIDKANAAYEAIVGKELESMNAQLRAKKLDAIKVLTKEEYERRES
jgi:hypothetical protein